MVKSASVFLILASIIILPHQAYGRCEDGGIRLANRMQSQGRITGLVQLCSNSTWYYVYVNGSDWTQYLETSACMDLGCTNVTEYNLQCQEERCSQIVEILTPCMTTTLIDCISLYPNNSWLTGVSCQEPSIPSPEVTISNKTNSSISLSWREVETNCGINANMYSYWCSSTEVNSTSELSARELNSTSELSARVSNLLPYTNYSCCVKAFFHDGNESNETCLNSRTSPAAPSAPRDVEYNSSTTTCVVSWREPQQVNDEHISYNVTLNGQFWTRTPTHSVTILHLYPYTEYNCCVYSMNTAGVAHNCSIFQTLAVHPSVPRDMQINFINATLAQVSWSEPQYPNGSVRYYLTCTDEPRSTYLNETSVSLEGLHPHTGYNCCVAALNDVGEGRNICTSFMTSEAVPSSSPENIRAAFITFGTLRLEWSPPSLEHRNGNITGYMVVLESSDGEFFRQIGTTDTSSTILGLKSGIYFYSISAKTRIGTGPASNQTAITNYLNHTSSNVVVIAAGGVSIFLLLICVVLVSIVIWCLRKRQSRKYNFRSRGRSKKRSSTKQADQNIDQSRADNIYSFNELGQNQQDTPYVKQSQKKEELQKSVHDISQEKLKESFSNAKSQSQHQPKDRPDTPPKVKSQGQHQPKDRPDIPPIAKSQGQHQPKDRPDTPPKVKSQGQHQPKGCPDIPPNAKSQGQHQPKGCPDIPPNAKSQGQHQPKDRPIPLIAKSQGQHQPKGSPDIPPNAKSQGQHQPKDCLATPPNVKTQGQRQQQKENPSNFTLQSQQLQQQQENPTIISGGQHQLKDCPDIPLKAKRQSQQQQQKENSPSFTQHKEKHAIINSDQQQQLKDCPAIPPKDKRQGQQQQQKNSPNVMKQGQHQQSKNSSDVKRQDQQPPKKKNPPNVKRQGDPHDVRKQSQKQPKEPSQNFQQKQNPQKFFSIKTLSQKHQREDSSSDVTKKKQQRVKPSNSATKQTGSQKQKLTQFFKRKTKTQNQGSGFVVAQLPTNVNFGYEDQEDNQSIASSSSSNLMVPELPSRGYLDDDEFARSLQIEPKEEHETKWSERGFAQLSTKVNFGDEQDAHSTASASSSNLVIPELPSRSYLDDAEFFRTLQVNSGDEQDAHSTASASSSNLVIPELPSRSYLDDAEFFHTLQVDPPPEDNKSVDSYIFMEKVNRLSGIKNENSHVIGMKDHMTASRDHASASHHEQKNVALPEMQPAENHYTSLCQATMDRRTLANHNAQKNTTSPEMQSSDGQYMPLSQATMDRRRGDRAGGVACTGTGSDYMEINQSTRVRYYKPLAYQ